MGCAVLFLDRDGTLNVDRGPSYVSTPEMIEIIPGVGDGIAAARAAGYKTALITNQAGIAKGLVPAHALPVIHRHLEDLIQSQMTHTASGTAATFRFDDIQVCPHRPEDKCPCRKPGVLMLTRSIEALSADASMSWFIGDHVRDLVTAQRAGIRSILVLTGHGRLSQQELKDLGDQAPRPATIAADLNAAVAWILRAYPITIPVGRLR